jgi:hypothetical protein
VLSGDTLVPDALPRCPPDAANASTTLIKPTSQFHAFQNRLNTFDIRGKKGTIVPVMRDQR